MINPLLFPPKKKNKKIVESAKGEIDAFEEAERDMLELERKLHSAEKVIPASMESSLKILLLVIS